VEPYILSWAATVCEVDVDFKILHQLIEETALDMIQATLSPIREYKSLLSVQTPVVTVTADDRTTQTMTRTSPDHIYIHGRLEDSAVFSYSLRASPAPPNSPVFIWNIHGTEGQIQITADTLLMRSFAQIRIVLQKTGGDTEDVKIEEDKYNRMNLGLATNTARLYAAFADRSHGGEYPDFNLAEERYHIVSGTQSAGRRS
jgi:predicted dehydrogenase